MPPKPETARGLTLKQRLFVEAYLGEANGNATQAAKAAGYRHPAELGYQLLQKTSVRDLVDQRVKEAAMEANRVLTLMSKIAEESGEVSDQLRALKLMGDHYGLWDVSRTDQAAREAAELARAQQAAADDEATIAELMEEHGLSREAAADLVADLHEAYATELAKRSMADELKAALLGGPLWRVSLARKDAIVREVCQRHGLIEPDEPEREPDPEPRAALPCGFRELPPPPIEPEPPWPDSPTAAALDPASEVNTQAVSGVLPGEYWDMPGFGTIKIERGK